MADLGVTAIRITAKDETQAALTSVDRGLRGLASTAGALAGALGGFAFGSMTKSAIDAADQVNKLMQQTGIAAREIDRLTTVAKLNDIETSSLAKNYKALATAMNEASDPASKQARMFEALGVKTKDAQGNLRGLAAVTLDIAKAFRDAKDGPEKMAVAVGAFGKAGIEMIPVLNNMAEDMDRANKISEAFGEVTAETAKAGDEFNDSLTLLGEGMQRTFLPAVESLGPAMGRFTEAMIDVGKQGSALQPILSVLFKDILPAAVETVGALIVAANGLAKSLGNLLGGLAAALVELAAGNFGSAWETAKAAWSDSGEILGESNKQIAALMDRSKEAAPAITQTAAATERMAKAARAIADGTGKKAADTFKEMAEAVKRWYDNAMAAIAADEEIVKQSVERYEALRKVIESEQKIVEQVEQTTASYEKQIEALELTEVQILAKERARQQEILTDKLATTGIDETTAAIERNIAALDRLINAKGSAESARSAKAAADEWARAAESIQNSLTDALMRGFESGKDWAKNFIDTLKNLFGSLVLRPIIQAVVSPLAGGITGALGFSGNAAASGGGSLLSGAGSLFGGLGALGSGASISMGNIGSLGLAGGTAANFANIGGQLSSGISGIMPALGMAMPYLAAAVAIGMAVKGILDSRRGGDKIGGTAGYGNFYPGETNATNNAAVQATVSAVNASYTALLKGLGGSGSAAFTLGYDTDPQGTAQSRVSAGAMVNGQSVYALRDLDVGRDDASLQAALETESKRALLAALQASDLPEQIAAVLDTMAAGSATSEGIDNLLAFGSAMKSVIAAIGGSVVEDAQAAWERSQRSSIEVLNDMGAEVIRLANDMDGTTGSMQALAAATGEYRSAVVQTLLAIKQISADIDAMFSATRDGLETFGLSPEQLYDRFRKDADEAARLLAATTDPAQVATLAQRINDDINKAFGAIGDDAKLTQQAPLLAYLDQISALAQERLLTIGALTGSATNDPFAAANAALDGAAAKFTNASDSQVTAANRQNEAANMMYSAAQVQWQAANTPLVVKIADSAVNA